MELSPDNSRHWINLLEDTTFHVYGSPACKPILTGRSAGWKNFYMEFDKIADSFEVRRGDTLLLRFTFVSDGVQTGRDGLMFDDLTSLDYYEGVEHIQKTIASKPFPNPAAQTFCIDVAGGAPDNWRISLFTVHGRKVKTVVAGMGKRAGIPVADLPAGVYYYTLTGLQTAQVSSGQLVVAH